MTDITIVYKDQLRVKVLCGAGTAYEISEEFAFFVVGYKHMPQYKAGRWDGKIRMFNLKTREFYKGLLHKLVKWAKENGYSVEIKDKESLKPVVKYDKSWLDNWRDYGVYEPKDYQVNGINEALRFNHCLVNSPTGSGKSYIMYFIARYMLENSEGNILITVPTTSLVEQLVAEFEVYSEGLGWDPNEFCCKIYSGKEKYTDHRIKISTWQSVHKLDQEWFDQFDTYMCDEAHGADAKCVSSIVDKLAHASVRVGLTGTLDGTTLHELEMLARFGPIVKTTTSSELMRSGELAQLNIKCLRVKYPVEDTKYVKGLDYQQEVKFIISNEERNKLIVKKVLEQDNNTLVLFNILNHGAKLYELLLKGAKKRGKNVYYIAGSVAVDEREKIRLILEKENNCILLATFGTFSTGVNVKNLHCAVFAHPYKAKIKTLQSIGRILRKMSGKDGVTLIDVADDISYVGKSKTPKPNSAMKHFIERLRVYQQEGFRYDIETVSLI